ncbi:hypothetical protein OED52_16695 [Rhodococcus sp. Z13]|uniref:Uncharacterized protein n=1 Tax=Rhodococcus sacchari TaxID=2962047 RepID=A0ACD4DE52_9NOCA|nr:hypothetical protein [Rhodococcus sp. Z13]UYP18282.1 hypothetical protein OED52_16695 [Rhodococcus sp. Z13]
MSASTAVRVAGPAAVLAAFLAAGVAVLVLAIGESVLPAATRSEAGPVVSAVLAVLAAAGLQRTGSRRTAWALAAGAVVVLASVRYLVPADASADTLTVMGLVVAATTGVLLGAATAAAWGSPDGQWVLVAGGWSAFLVAAAVGTEIPFEVVRWTVPQWTLVVALVATLAAALTIPVGMRVQRADPRLLAMAIGAAAVLSVGYLLLGDLVSDRATSAGLLSWLIVGGALTVTVVGAEITARVVAPGDDRFVLTVTGALAASYPMVAEVWSGMQTSIMPWWVLLVVVAAVVAGVRLAGYMPYALPGLLLAAAVTAATVWWPDEIGDGIPLAVRAALVALGTGLALGASLPGSTSVAALGLALPVPMAAVIGAVWVMPADPKWVVLALVATASVCAWQVR